MVNLVRFSCRRLFLKKKEISMHPDEAKKHLRDVCPDPARRPGFEREAFCSKIDLSIIVPVYNYVNLIEENIRSILEQETQYRYELILVDDGSTDGSKKVLEDYAKDPKVKVIFQENQGIGGARNTGIRSAVGRYLMFVDCDDVIHPDMVERMMTEAYRGGFDIVMCAHDLVKIRSGQETARLTNCYPQKNLLGLKNGDEIMNYAGLPWGKVYRRELFDQVRFFPGYWYEDTIVHFLLFTQCRRFSYLPVTLYDYRWYEGNYSHIQGHSENARAVQYYWLLLAILENCRNRGVQMDNMLYTVLLRHLSAYCYSKIARLDEKTKTAIFVLACELLKSSRPAGKIALPYMLRVTEKAMLKGDYALWKLASGNQ